MVSAIPSARPNRARGSGTVCIFTRPPVAGRTKTRLIDAFGPEGARDLALASFLDTLELVRRAHAGRLVVALSESGELPGLAPEVPLWQQGEGDLGDRMTRMARQALAVDPAWVVIVGSDSPGLAPEILKQAIVTLEQGAPAVLGPADDGGYYLLGLRRCPERLLRGLEWSTSQTARLTLERLRQHQFEIHLLPPWFDIDRPEDVERLEGLLARGEATARSTAQVLRRLRA